MKHPSIPKIIVGVVVALLLSVLQPFLVPFSMMLCVTTIAIALLYAWAGWIPALVASAGTMAVLGGFGHIVSGESTVALMAALLSLVMQVLPAWAAIWALNRRMPFFRRMAVGIAAQIAAFTAVLCVIYVGYRIDLADLLTAQLNAAVNAMPAGIQSLYLDSFRTTGLLTEESLKMVTTGWVTSADRQKAFAQAFEVLNYRLKQTLPGMTLVSGLLTGIFVTTLPSLMCVRRGDEPQVDHQPVNAWYLPGRAVGGIVVCIATCFALSAVRFSGVEAVSSAVLSVASVLFTVQGVAALGRRFKENGMGRGGRLALLVAGVLMAQNLITLVGGMSALMGRHGVLSGWMRKKMEEHKEDDDE